MSNARYSDFCHDPTTRWDRSSSQCVLCNLKPGYEITPNCGFDDDGGRRDVPLRQCEDGTFNDGSMPYCQPCTRCQPGYQSVNPCNSTTDTKCAEIRPTDSTTTRLPTRETTASVRETTAPPTVPTASGGTSAFKPSSSSAPSVTAMTIAAPHLSTPHVLWAVPLVLFIFFVLLVLSACLIYMKRNRLLHRKGQPTELTYKRKLSYTNSGFSSLTASPGNDLEDILSPTILSAPLQTVLDDLDVLEELIILLDPESHGKKNTKHLASRCSFPSSWITYTYSMKDSKSPLKAVLEGVTCKHPDWTVKHLAKLLRHMERNDAIAALANLRRDVSDV